MATENPDPLDLDAPDPDAPSAADRAWCAEHANDPPAARALPPGRALPVGAAVRLRRWSRRAGLPRHR
jgi:hypothetical protein